MIDNKKDTQILWQQFSKRHNLTTEQLEQFQLYYNMLKSTNEIHNLTAITDLESVIYSHFDDSLALNDLVNCNELKVIADVGTGGGFPGIPLKIVYPHLRVILIEVTYKKIQFLNDVINALNLTSIETNDTDWRTFLRKTEYPIELFCARASLQPSELLRIFKPACIYKNSRLVYWASKTWKPEPGESSYIKNIATYQAGKKQRRLILFQSAG